MLNISNDDEKYLDREEIANREFKLKDKWVLTSSSRLFIKNDNNVKYVDYADISSIELLVRRKWLIISLGLSLIAATLNLQQFEPSGWVNSFLPGKLMWGYGDDGSTYIIAGAMLILFGFLQKTLNIKFKVAHSNDEFALSGDKSTVDALFRLVNERKSQT